ncbi:MAG TPA: hypothetical protein P5545_08405, partial [Bacteroidota bacterium]|nr:hypothetical protein [Bacteroidota bacterium]
MSNNNKPKSIKPVVYFSEKYKPIIAPSKSIKPNDFLISLLKILVCIINIKIIKKLNINSN